MMMMMMIRMLLLCILGLLVLDRKLMEFCWVIRKFFFNMSVKEINICFISNQQLKLYADDVLLSITGNHMFFLAVFKRVW
jgi:hypothetical protein